MKKEFAAWAVVCAMLPVGAVSFADEEISVYVNDKKAVFDVAPEMKNDRTFVPIRAVADMLLLDVSYDEPTRQVTLKSDTADITLTIDSYTAAVNGAEKTLDTAPYETGGRTLVPLRFISEMAECDVVWDEASKSVYITEKKKADPDQETPSGTEEKLTYDIADLLYAETDMYAFSDGCIYYAADDEKSELTLYKYTIKDGESKAVTAFSALSAKDGSTVMSKFTPNAVETDDVTGRVWFSGTFASGGSGSAAAVYCAEDLENPIVPNQTITGVKLRAVSDGKLLFGNAVIDSETGEIVKIYSGANSNVIFGIGGVFYGADGTGDMTLHTLDEPDKAICKVKGFGTWYSGGGKFYYRTNDGKVFFVDPSAESAESSETGIPFIGSEKGYGRFENVGQKMYVGNGETILYDASRGIFCLTADTAACAEAEHAAKSKKKYAVNVIAQDIRTESYDMYGDELAYIDSTDANVYKINTKTGEKTLFKDLSGFKGEDNGVYSEFKADSIKFDEYTGRLFVSGIFYKNGNSPTERYAAAEITDEPRLIAFIKKGEDNHDIKLITRDGKMLTGGLLYDTESGDAGITEIYHKDEDKNAIFKIGDDYIRLYEEVSIRRSGVSVQYDKNEYKTIAQISEKQSWKTIFEEADSIKAYDVKDGVLYMLLGRDNAGAELAYVDLINKYAASSKAYEKQKSEISLKPEDCGYPKSFSISNLSFRMFMTEDGGAVLYDKAQNRVLKVIKN